MMASLPRLPPMRANSNSPSPLEQTAESSSTSSSRRAPPLPSLTLPSLPSILPSTATPTTKQSYLPGWPASNERGYRGGGGEEGESSLRGSFNSTSPSDPPLLPPGDEPLSSLHAKNQQQERKAGEGEPNHHHHHPSRPQDGPGPASSSAPSLPPPPATNSTSSTPWMAPSSSSSSSLHERPPPPPSSQPYYANSNIPRPTAHHPSYYPPPPPHHNSAQTPTSTSYPPVAPPPPPSHRPFSSYPPPPPPPAPASSSSHSSGPPHHHQLAPSDHQPWSSAHHQPPPQPHASSSSHHQPYPPPSHPAHYLYGKPQPHPSLLPILPPPIPKPRAPPAAPPKKKTPEEGGLIVGVVVPEYRMVGAVRMLVGKGGRLFDPNPAAGSGEKDFECCFCDKVYKGKHARSIWRRHLCDKHGIPLSDQPRRTRWDKNEGRPKTDEERRERSLESKRKWASKKRALQKANRSGSDEDVIHEEEEADDLEEAQEEEEAIVEGTKGKRKAPAKAAGRAPPKKKVAAAKGKGKEKVAPAPIRASGPWSSTKRKEPMEPASHEESDQQRRRQESGEGAEANYESEEGGDQEEGSPDDSTTTAPPFQHQHYALPPSQRQPQNQQVFAQLPYDAVHPRNLPQYTSHPPNYYPTPTYHPSTHYPPPPIVPARFDVPRRPLSALGSTSPHKARPQMTMPGFSPQRRSSFPSRGRDDAPLVGMARGVEDDGAAALLMALRANGSSPVKPSTLEYEAESEEDEEDASPPSKEVWTSEMDAGVARYESSATRVKEEDRSSPIKYEEPATFDYSRTFKEEEDDYEEEEEREMERRKLERQTLFPVVPKALPGMGRRSRQPSLVGPPKASPSSTTESIPIPRSRASSALSPLPAPLPFSSKETNLESSPAFPSARTEEDFLQSSPPSPGMIGRSPPTNHGILSSPVEHLSNDASSSRFSQVRSKPVPMGTPTPSARMMGGSGAGSSSSRPSIGGLRWGEDVKRSMEVAYEGKGRGRALGMGGLAASGSGTPSRLWGAASSSSRHVQDRRDDEASDEDDDDEREDSKPFNSHYSNNLVASSPSSSPVDNQTGPSSLKRDFPLEPLFIPPQIPHRRPSSTPLTSLISGSGTATPTHLPIFHPTPFKPSIPLGMTSIQSYTSNVSSTRTPFKSSSSSHGHPSSTPSNNSTLLNAIPSSQASQNRYSTSSAYAAPGSSTRTTHLGGSSPPASSFFQLSSPQSLSLTRSLGLAPATPGNGSGMWGVATTPDGNGGGGGPEASGRKRKGSWAVSASEEGKRVKGPERGRDSGFFEESEEGERGEVKKEEE